jgi:hypothetical protein
MQIHDFAGMTGEEREALQRVLEAHESLDDVFAWGYEMPAPLPEELVAAYAAS